MTVQDDLSSVKQSRDSDEAIIQFWSAAEYAHRTLVEQLAKMNDAAGDVDLENCPDSIEQDGTDILTKVSNLVDNLEANHADFLNWDPNA